MIKEMEKALKRYLKGKNRITTGVVVAFLLGSSFAFGDVTIKYDTAASTLIVQDDLGTNIGTVTKNPAGEFTWTLPEGANITETVKIDDTVNTNNIKVNIVNSGTISSSGTTGKSGNGLFSYSDTSSSIIGNITNSGNISGNSTGGDSSGNGIYACSDSYISISSSIIGNITNSGIISGSTTGSGNDSGNGIYSSSVNGDSTIGDITNSGIISGNGDASTSGNGIYSSSYSFDSYPESEIGNITNYGIISGSNSGRYNGNGIYSYSSTTNGSTKSKIDNITNYGIISGNNSSSAGHGIYLRSISGLAIIESISNYGVIMGSQNGIYVDGDSRSSSSSSSGITNYNNYGLVIGRTPVFVDKDGSGPNTFSDPEGQGMAITLESDGSIKTNGITSGTGGSTGIYSIVNTQLRDNLGSAVSSGAVDSYDVYTSDQSISDTIINGTGAKLTNGTVTINAGNFSLTNGIINAYKTAVTVNAGASFTGTDVTINGGGLDRTAPVISGDSGANTVNISGNSFINGKVDLGDGDDILSIGNSTQINGDIDGGTGTDTLDFGSAIARAVGNDNINLFHKISNVEEININQKVTAFETSEITGAENIPIGADGVLTLKIDSAKTANLGGQDKIIGHALYGNNGKITSTGGGKLLLALNGAGNESIISFGTTILDGSLVTGSGGTFDTTSKLHTIESIDGANNEVKVVARWIIPEIFKYKQLNKIYHGILSIDELGNFNVDNDEKLTLFIGYLNDIYAGNPYSYSSELSRKSMGMFRDIVTENSFKADTGRWMIYGGLTHIDGGTKDTYYGKGYYTYDIGSSDIDADTKITGAYMLGEYGVSDGFKAGVAVGGNKLKSDLSNGSKVDGSAMYLGAYAKKYLGNLKVTAGAGFQYGDYDADRLAINNVASAKAEPVMKYSDNYNDISYDIYLNGRYSHNIGANLYLEPYGTLSYTYVDQDGADEGNKTLAIETDSKSFDYTSAKVGLDLKKVIPHEKGKSTLSVGASYTRLLNGADEEYITGTFKGKLLNGESAKNFDILVAHKNEHSIGFNAKYTLKLENGILFDVKGTYSVERDSHNQSGKNKTKGEWIVGTGLGYKF